MDEKVLTEADTFVLQTMIFDRLAPLLVLRTLAVKTFAHITVDAPKLTESLVGRYLPSTSETRTNADDVIRILADFEFDDVRKLSAEVLGKFPPAITLPLIVEELQ